MLCIALLAACTVGAAGDDDDSVSPDGAVGAPDARPGLGDAGDAPDPDAADPCEPIAGAVYSTLSTAGPTTDRPAPVHADLNIALRGWTPTGSTLGLIDISGPTDALAPQLATLFTDDRLPEFVANYRVNNWDWGTNSVAGPITEWDVTLIGVATATGEIVELPDSGYDIGGGMEARVLYAGDDSITLKYTREDNVVSGYTVHFTGVCVDAALRALYEASDAAGRGELPALSANQPIGRARSAELGVLIRDTGAFMDPRARKDWWQGL
jgi:hypothetical protein